MIAIGCDDCAEGFSLYLNNGAIGWNGLSSVQGSDRRDIISFSLSKTSLKATGVFLNNVEALSFGGLNSDILVDQDLFNSNGLETSAAPQHRVW